MSTYSPLGREYVEKYQNSLHSGEQKMWSMSNTLLYLGLWHTGHTLGWKYPKQINKCMQLSQVNLGKDSQITQ